MDNRIDQITKGLISLTVMLMFTVAFVAGQARANLQADAWETEEITPGFETSVILGTESLRKLESLSHLVDSVISLPIVIEFSMGELSIRTDKADKADAASSDDVAAQ